MKRMCYKYGHKNVYIMSSVLALEQFQLLLESGEELEVLQSTDAQIFMCEG